MSFTEGPCPKCGETTMYDDWTPTLCGRCRRGPGSLEKAIRADAVNRVALRTGNRRNRRAAAKARRIL